MDDPATRAATIRAEELRRAEGREPGDWPPPRRAENLTISFTGNLTSATCSEVIERIRAAGKRKS
jgi:hypothetical protein